MPSPPRLHDLACVAHLHSTHSDGTGTVAQIARAARRNALDVVLLTDHDTLAARHHGEDGWRDDVLVLTGCEVTPKDRNHLLAFGLEEEIDHAGLDPGPVCDLVAEQGGVCFAAHPFSTGSALVERVRPIPYEGLRHPALTGIELWSFVNDTLQPVDRWRDLGRFIARPEALVDHPPALNVSTWDELCAERRLVALGGLDAHQIGIRVAGRVPFRLMSYARSFRYIRTHVLCERLPSGDATADAAQVYDALREGRCYLSVDAFASPRGFAFWADGPDGPLPMGAEAQAGDWTVRARSPRPAELVLRRDGAEVARALGTTVEHRCEGPGVYRAEARLEVGGRSRTWVMSNPIYLR